uniref:Intercellular adhesion molecule N-terminal domain-containing protein n=1 Tax=Gopherus evgoodei TaxID=1825980 RepID=A0A8C5F236_9SAUR
AGLGAPHWPSSELVTSICFGSFEVSVSPEAPMVEHGGSVWINCSTTCQDPGARGGLETSLIKTGSKSGPGWAAFLLVAITEWVSAPQCYFTCKGDTKVAAANISSYWVPERVVLEPLPKMELGRAYNLTCWVLNVAPVTHLTVTLRQGGRTLHTETFQNHTGTGPNDIPVTHEITPRRWDHGQEITCHAALDLTPHGPHFENSSSAVELKVYGEFPHAPFQEIQGLCLTAQLPAVLTDMVFLAHCRSPRGAPAPNLPLYRGGHQGDRPLSGSRGLPQCRRGPVHPVLWGRESELHCHHVGRHGHRPGRGLVPVPGTARAELHRDHGARVQIRRTERSHLQ